MNVCLIRCPSPFLIDEWVFPPLGLMAVATSLKRAGHEVRIVDNGDVPMDCDAYGFGPTTPEYGYALDKSAEIRKHNPSARIVIGGAYATLDPQKCLDDGFDCVVTGDGEPVAPAAFTGTMQIADGGEEEPIESIIDRSVIDLSKYKYFLNGIRATTLMTSQGCPFRCGFCCKNYKTVRFSSVKKVIEEIDYLHFRLGYNALVFPEDLFIINRARTEAIAGYLGGLGIIWRCLVRADLVEKYGSGFSGMMADSGCVEVGMGIESGSDNILRTIGKGETSGTMLEAVRLLKGAGIRVKGFFILGLPGESERTLEETWEFLRTAGLDDVDIKIYQPYPGTPIWDRRADYDISWDDNIDYSRKFYKGRPKEYFGNVRTSGLTNERLVSEWVRMEAAFKREFTGKTQAGVV